MIEFLTTATSGSQSIYRVLMEYSKLLEDDLDLIRGSMMKGFKGVVPENKYVINIRDPRDIWCNQYYWLVQHPAPSEDVRLARKARYDKGIDSSVLKNARVFTSDSAAKQILNLVSHHRNKKNVCFISYAQLCMKFEEMILRLNKFLLITPTPEIMKVINLESPAGLESNDKWIGKDWAGCDIMPGRYKNELKSDTIQELNEILRSYLESIKSVEIEELKYLYEL
jgi:hypothetical protein